MIHNADEHINITDTTTSVDTNSLTNSETYVLVSENEGDSITTNNNNGDNDTTSSNNNNSSDDEEDSDTEELTDIFPSPPPSTPIAGDTPVRMRGIAVPVPRWSSPTASATGGGVSDDGDTTTVGGVEDTDTASYQELANRPRSNPRVRTPMRNVSAVPLGTVNRSTIHDDDDNHHHNTTNASLRTTAAAGSGRDGDTSGGRRVLGLGAGLSVGTVLRESDLVLLQQQRMNRIRTNTKNNNTLASDKQGPSHRKLRRWNNDKFVGIASDISHANPTARGTQIATIYAEADLDKHTYTMPNYPLEYKSYFTTLLQGGGSTTTTAKGDDNDNDGVGGGSVVTQRDGAGKEYTPQHVAHVRERFIRGEVCATTDVNAMTDGAKNRLRRREEDIFRDGGVMAKRKVQERLLNVVRRACQSSEFSREVLCAFEGELVKQLSSFEDDGVVGEQITADVIEERKAILEKVLTQKPMVTRKGGSNGVKNTTIRFLFDNESNEGAFNRLLLHGVSQFHGLVTSSTTISRGHRLLTVTGVCKGCQFRFLDFLDLAEEERLDDNRDVDVGLCSSSAPVLAQSMATIKVS